MKFVNKKYSHHGSKNGWRHRSTVMLALGMKYEVATRFGTKTVEFIKVTPKGFNFLDHTTHKCIVKGHLYSKGYAGKNIPRNEKIFNVQIPCWIAGIRSCDHE